MSLMERALVVWSGVAAVWWLISVWLVNTRQDARQLSGPRESAVASVSIFKPLPSPTSPEERIALASAIESFLIQLEPGAELLVGLPTGDEAVWQPLLDEWKRRFPGQRIRVCCEPIPRQRANPKVAWLEKLAPVAQGEFWLWSDTDIVAPPDLLGQLRRALTEAGAGAVTCPYSVRRVPVAPAALDAAFVNAEFLPGALLLGRRGAVDFAFGAATIFRSEDFWQHVSWDELGAALADDYALGQQLKPVALRGPMVETLALETTISGALRHYYRWQKTIRWCRPGGYAALLSILPLPGWGLFAAAHSLDPMAWLGLGAQWAVEFAAVAALCRAVGCRMSPGAWAALFLWPPIRALTWMAVWLPLPVRWRGAPQRWSRPTV